MNVNQFFLIVQASRLYSKIGVHLVNIKCKTITCNEEMKGNAKCKNSRFEPPLGDLGVTHRVHLWLHGKRIVDFLLVIIELFFASDHGCCTIKLKMSKSAFSEGVGHFKC